MCVCVLVQYLSIESSFDGKDVVCKRLLQFLMDPADGAVEERSSFQLLEVLLYRTQLSVFTGRVHNGQHILQVCVHTHSNEMRRESVYE